jgi:hypothetical protein
MSTSFRYLIVTATGLLLILGPFAWAFQFMHDLRAELAKRYREHEVSQGNVAAAKLSDDEILKDGFGAELPPEVVIRITIADILFKFWWVWSLFVVALSYGLFVMLPRGTTPENSASKVALPDR